jgi:hypothetical protein
VNFALCAKVTQSKDPYCVSGFALTYAPNARVTENGRDSSTP